MTMFETYVQGLLLGSTCQSFLLEQEMDQEEEKSRLKKQEPQLLIANAILKIKLM